MDNLRAGVTPPSEWDALRRELAEARAELSAARRDKAAVADVLRIVSGDRMRRRAFLAGLGAACACAPMARAQEQPVIGVLHAGSVAENVKRVAAFREGLKQSGFVEGRNLTIEYRWAQGHADRLEALAADLAQRRVSLIATPAVTAAAVAARKVTRDIPIVFAVGSDPVALGLVDSLSHPGGNATGVTSMNASLGAKRFELARELAPKAKRCITLVNPASPISLTFLEALQAGAAALGIRLDVLHAQNQEEIDAAFAGLPSVADAVFLSSPDYLFYGLRARIVAQVTQLKLPSLFDVPEYVEDGGLASYGNDFIDAIRQSGVYAGRILKGEKPQDLPVVQPETFVLAINLKTASTLGLEIPPDVLAAANEVIE